MCDINITYQKEIDAIIQINLNKTLINDKTRCFSTWCVLSNN